MNIIVTGASRGIGFEVVRAFAYEKRNKIIAVARSKERLDELFKLTESFREGGEVIPVPFDLSEIDRFRRDLVPTIQKHFECVDILINNAGYLTNKSFMSITRPEVEMNLTMNFTSPYFLIQALIDQLLKSDHAHIVNISSMGGFQGSAKFPGLSAYSASKAALANLTECLAAELKDSSISVNCLALGAVQTEMLAEAFPGYKAPIEPPEMASFIKDFSTNGSSYFNGRIVPVTASNP